ncbi:sodium channel protein Nach [Calliopsis andreniformis]|uniref:sodium channel protein Nach n=1 Tax=Calliopsis andreniformis TaxID=337506 RepID=UPI003FCC40A4
MSKHFSTRNQEFLYFNDSSTKIQKRSIGKTIQVVNAKVIPDLVDSPKKKEKVPTVQDVLNDFFESTSVHGLQYFGKIDIKVGFCGKIFWACTILTGFVCLSLMVMQFLNRYSDNPTNTYIKSFYHPIFKAPFPAITICPSTPIPLHRRLAIFEGMNLPDNVSQDLAMNILKYGHYITLPYLSNTYDMIYTLESILQANKWSLTNFLKILKPCDDIVESCWWNSEHIDCDESIKLSYTSYGLCCSFNYLLEELVGREKRQPTPEPLTSVDFGRRSGLKLLIKKDVLTVEDDSDEISKAVSNNDGMVLLLHHSVDYPGLNTNSYILQKGRELQITVRPEMIKKPAGLYHRNKNNEVVPVCIPNNKNILDYFPVYRYSNCYANCRIKSMLYFCGCLPFIYDYLTDFYPVKRCNINGLVCIQKHSKMIGIVRDIQFENFTCSCRAPCEELVYEGSLNSINLRKTHLAASYSNVTTDHAVLRLYMSSQVYQVIETIPAADEFYLLGKLNKYPFLKIYKFN